MAEFLYEFEWDPLKAQTNFNKHQLDFELASSVFLDPLALTIADEEHSKIEPRWITLGRDATDRYVLVVHTFERLSDNRGRIRLISARRPTRVEVNYYEKEQ